MTIEYSEIIDLTHAISEGIPHWPGDPKTQISPQADVARDGYNLNALSIGEHTGTHIGAPWHFNRAGWSIDDIPVHQLVAPAIHLNIMQNAQKERDYLLTVNDVIDWEAHNGHIDKNAVVIINSGWFRFWKTDHYLGTDGHGLHFPGVSVEAADYLIRQRHIRGMGIDSAGIDGGQSTDFAANSLLAEHNLYHLENLNLRQLAVPRFTIVIGAIPIKNGSGSPCRVFGFV